MTRDVLRNQACEVTKGSRKSNRQVTFLLTEVTENNFNKTVEFFAFDHVMTSALPVSLKHAIFSLAVSVLFQAFSTFLSFHRKVSSFHVFYSPSSRRIFTDRVKWGKMAMLSFIRLDLSTPLYTAFTHNF